MLQQGPPGVVHVRFFDKDAKRKDRTLRFLMFVGILTCIWSSIIKWRQELASADSCENFITFANIGQHGRLGNQLFQVASTIGIAEANGLPWLFPAIISSTSVGKLFGLAGSDKIDTANCVELVEEKKTFYQPQIPRTQDCRPVSLMGYFQNLQYFENSSTVRDKFRVLPEIKLTVENAVPEVLLENSVTMHVRRGDYVGLSNIFQLMSKEYYLEALDHIQHIDALIIVSDDVEWCKEQFSYLNQTNVVFSPFADELLDFVLISLGRHIIIANSTFSWWAAYLKGVHASPARAGVIVAPDVWYREDGPLSHLNRVSFFPETWTLVSSKQHVALAVPAEPIDPA
jgi:hypothetical protein